MEDVTLAYLSSFYLSFMAASKNQFHRYYIYGEFQDCSIFRKAMTSCASYKATKSPEDRVCLIVFNFIWTSQ